MYNSKLQGEQALLAYSCRRSFDSVSMVFGVNSCCCWSANCWVELRSFHYFSLLPWPFPWHHLFCSPIPDEAISCRCISHNCHRMLLFYLTQSLYHIAVSFLENFCKSCSSFISLLLRFAGSSSIMASIMPPGLLLVLHLNGGKADVEARRCA